MSATSMSAKYKKVLAATMSGILAASLGIFAFQAAEQAPTATAEETPALVIEDITDEPVVEEKKPATLRDAEELKVSVLSDRIAYLESSNRSTAPENAPLLSIVEPGQAYTQPSMAYDFDSGVVWKDVRKPMFMDRLNYTDIAGYSKTVYNNLKKFSNFDGKTDVLIENKAYSLTSDESKWNESPDENVAAGAVIRQDSINYVVMAKIKVGDNTDWEPGDPRVENVLNWAYAAWCSYLRDCPEYTYWYTRNLPQFALLPLNTSEDNGKFAIVMVTNSLDNEGNQVSMRNSQWDTAAKIKSTHTDMMNQVNSLVSQASSLGTDYEKIKLFNKWLCDNNEYQYGASAKEWIPFTAPAALTSMERGPVCEGYSKAFQLLCQKSNVPVTVQTGYTSEDHMWNLVQLAGKWYMVDVTGNDTGAGIDYYLAAGSKKTQGHKINDAIVYYLADGTPFMSLPFENAPLIEENDYIIGDTVVISVPDDPIQVYYGQTVGALYPNPMEVVKSNTEAEWCEWEYKDTPFNALGTQERRCVLLAKPIVEGYYQDPYTATVLFEVLPLDIEPSMSLDQETYEHTGSAITPNVNVSYNGTNIDPSLYTVSYKNNVNVGTATVSVESKDNSPYTFTASTTFSIVKKQTPVDPDPVNMTATLSPVPVYGSTSKISVSGAPAGAKLSYDAIKGSFEIIGDNIKPKSIGDSEILITAVSDSGQTFTSTYKFTVAKRPMEITVKANDRAYNGNNKATGTVSASNLAEGDGNGSAVVVKIDSATFADANAGTNKTVTFNLSVTGDKSNCYTYPTTLTSTASIAPYDLASLSCSVGGGEIRNGQSVVLPDSASITGLTGSSVNGTVKWYKDAEMTQEITASDKFEGTKGTSKTFYYKVTVADSNYTGQKNGSAQFVFVDDPASSGDNPGSNENQNTNQGGNQNSNQNTNQNTNQGTTPGGNENSNANQGTTPGGNENQNINSNQGTRPGEDDNKNSNAEKPSTNVNGNGNAPGENVNWSGNESNENKEEQTTPVLPGTDNPGSASDAPSSDNAANTDSSSGSADSAAMTQTGDAILGIVAIAMFSVFGCALAMFINRRRR